MVKILGVTCRLKDTGWQSISHRILLANRFKRRRRTCQKIQRLPNVCKTSPRTSSQSYLHPTRLAFFLLGARSSRTPKKSKRRLRVHLRSNRQIHQVDWIQTTREVQRNQSSRVHPRHYAPLRHAQSNHHRSRLPLHSYRIQKLGTRLWFQSHIQKPTDK